VRSTIDLANHLELKVVAEGIETQSVLDRLAALGCGAGQGYFIARPLPAEELTQRLMTAPGLGAPEIRPVDPRARRAGARGGPSRVARPAPARAAGPRRS
jgi:predicted signal transduction protein with EAL and GGDEF domain